MSSEVMTFAAFGGLQAVFHSAHAVHKIKVLEKLSRNHYIVWVFHPVVAHTLQDYVIHIVIYSGKIIAGH